ncbi:MAG TPA: IPT/TIG domain-containing protein [Polyangiaceae bacterium]|nr:IPT/TIG domain-containing protein [Polyangiaceae bacterium]
MAFRTTPYWLLCLIGCASACLRVISTPDAWPCHDDRDCGTDEICFFGANMKASGEHGECRAQSHLDPGPGPVAFAGQGGQPNWVSMGTSGTANGTGSWITGGSMGLGPFGDPSFAGALFGGGYANDVPIAGASGGTASLSPCGSGLWPQVDSVSPSVLGHRSTTVIIRGHGFSSVGPVLTVSLGGATVGSVIPDSDTQITFQTPVVPDGPAYYPLKVSSDLCPGTSDVRLLFTDPAGLSAQVIDAPSTRERLIFDAERHMLYAVNRTDQEIERYAEHAGSWETLKPYAVPELTDIAWTPNGRSLLVASRAAISEIDLDAPKFEATQRAVSPDVFCDQYFHQLATANDGNVLVVTRMASCTGFTASFLYSITNHLLTRAGPSLDFGMAAASFDGSRIYSGGSQSTINVYNSLSGTSTAASNVMYELRSLSVSGDASRVILQNTDVRSRALALTGKLPADGVALASIDSTRAFVFRTDSAGAHLVIHDLNGTLEAGALYPVLKTIDLARNPSAADDIYPSIVMTSTPDDSAVFISGTHSILVVPVN